MDWDGDLAQLAVVSPGNEQDVEAFLQMLSFFRFNGQGRNSRQCSDVAESLFGQPDCSGARVPILGVEIPHAPCCFTGTNGRASKSFVVCNSCCLQFLRNAELSSARDLHE